MPFLVCRLVFLIQRVVIGQLGRQSRCAEHANCSTTVPACDCSRVPKLERSVTVTLTWPQFRLVEKLGMFVLVCFSRLHASLNVGDAQSFTSVPACAVDAPAVVQSKPGHVIVQSSILLEPLLYCHVTMFIKWASKESYCMLKISCFCEQPVISYTFRFKTKELRGMDH